MVSAWAIWEFLAPIFAHINGADYLVEWVGLYFYLFPLQKLYSPAKFMTQEDLF